MEKSGRWQELLLLSFQRLAYEVCAKGVAVADSMNYSFNFFSAEPAEAPPSTDNFIIQSSFATLRTIRDLLYDGLGTIVELGSKTKVGNDEYCALLQRLGSLLRCDSSIRIAHDGDEKVKHKQEDEHYES